MPEARALLGRIVEIIGWLACVLGLAAAFWLVTKDGPIAAWVSDMWRALTGGEDLRLTATLTGAVCLLPGLALIPRWTAALMAPRAPTSGRRLAVLLCLLIAGLAVAAIASLWSEVRVVTR